MNLLTSDQTNITINGQQTTYFMCKRGLIQGDPLSLYLFNLDADTLAKILNKAKEHGYIKGLGNFNNNNNMINLNFADDTLIFLQTDVRMLEALKLILIGFKNLSGFKINYAKHELIPLNISDQESTKLAQLFGCKISKLTNYIFNGSSSLKKN
jgi:Reverse transcriptase (RNA-dependent DNA polymerase)